MPPRPSLDIGFMHLPPIPTKSTDWSSRGFHLVFILFLPSFWKHGQSLNVLLSSVASLKFETVNFPSSSINSPAPGLCAVQSIIRARGMRWLLLPIPSLLTCLPEWHSTVTAPSLNAISSPEELPSASNSLRFAFKVSYLGEFVLVLPEENVELALNFSTRSVVRLRTPVLLPLSQWSKNTRFYCLESKDEIWWKHLIEGIHISNSRGRMGWQLN